MDEDPLDQPDPPDPLTFEVVDPASADATWALQHYFAELDARFDGGFDAAAALAEGAPGMREPDGFFVIARWIGDVVGCGGGQRHDAETHEIKRMWIHSDGRGRGIGRRLLGHLELQSRHHGSTRVILDTNSALTEAIAMYTRSGYAAIERYNDNPYARHWFEKRFD